MGEGVGKVLFRVGQILLSWGIICFIVSLATAYWVVRPTIDYTKENINPNETLVTRNYGIFVACKQSSNSGRRGKSQGECGSLWENLNFINADLARYIQVVMVVAAILYAVGIILEIIQFLPIQKFRNFIAKNRLVEMFAGIATVLVLKGMVIFAGEIKNKAERVSGQEDEQSGWSFIVALIGLIISVIGLVMVTMFRGLPIHRPGKTGGSWLRRSTNERPTSAYC